MTDPQTLDQYVRLVPAGRTQEEMLFDIKLPTIPATGDRLDLEWKGVKYNYLVVSRTFEILMDDIDGNESFGEHLPPVKTIVFVEELAVDALNLRHGKFNQKGSQ